MDIKTKFLSQIEKLDDSGCWQWQGTKNGAGYGQFYLGPKKDGGYKGTGAHRASYTLFVKKIPKGKQVLHRCDNKVCVNPEHLFIGTAKDNMQDAIKKGRNCRGEEMRKAVIEKVHRGEQHHKTNLTAKDIRKIKNLREQGLMYKEIASKINASEHQIGKICRGERWRHVD